MRALLIAILLAGSSLAFGGEIADYHQKHARDKYGFDSKSRTREEIESTDHGITEIGIERTLCFGTCPIYTFIVKSDGTCRYEGVKYVERIGKHTGKIDVERFHKLAQFIKDSEFSKLADGYTMSVTDHPTIYTMVVLNDKRKTVMNYAEAGPIKLWAMEQLIDDLMDKTEWDGPPKP